MTRLPGRLLRYWHTARHLRPTQWCYRLKNAAQGRYQQCFPDWTRQRLLQRIPAGIVTTPVGQPASWFVKRFDGERGMFTAGDVLRGRFTFLHESKQFDGPVSWTNPELPYLWDFNLHYFEYLGALAPLLESADMGVAEQAVAVAGRLIDDWIVHNPCPSRPAWHPYPTSLRVIHWTKLLANHHDLASAERLKSLYLQLLYLERNLEKHLLSNHYWENARALLFGGLFFQGADAERWTGLGLGILQREVREQILPHGGHYERSPMYHCIVLEGLLDTHAWLTTMRHDTAWLKPVMLRMCRWLEEITCPDGSFPLFNDAALGISAAPDEILDNAQRMIGYRRSAIVRDIHVQDNHLQGVQEQAACEQAVYEQPVRDCDQFFVLDGGPLFCVVDGAPIGPDYNPGHAHSDNFTFELFLDGQRLVADAGTFSYEKGESREAYRSTAAHNTVTVNGLEQSEVWGGFRVARRSNPHLSRAWQEDGYLVYDGTYRNRVRLRQKITHRRVLILKPPSWLLVWDRITARGPIEAISRLHFAPDWTVQPAQPAYHIIGPEGAAVSCYPLEVNEVNVGTAEHAPEFGRSIPIQRMSFTKQGKDVVEFGYVLHVGETPPSPPRVRTTSNDTGESIEVAVGADRGTFLLQRK